MPCRLPNLNRVSFIQLILNCYHLYELLWVCNDALMPEATNDANELVLHVTATLLKFIGSQIPILMHIFTYVHEN